MGAESIRTVRKMGSRKRAMCRMGRFWRSGLVRGFCVETWRNPPNLPPWVPLSRHTTLNCQILARLQGRQGVKSVQGTAELLRTGRVLRMYMLDEELEKRMNRGGKRRTRHQCQKGTGQGARAGPQRAARTKGQRETERKG